MPVKIDQLFGALQQQLQASLRVVREVVDHPTAKGDEAEADWITMLGSYLPKRYRVAGAFVVDCEGSISEQMDVVVFDRQYSPLLFFHGQCLYVPAEAVYAVFEVKPEFSKEYVEYAGKKVASVRRLKRTSAPIVHAGGKVDKPKAPFRIPGGLLALNSTWKPAMGDSLVNALQGLSPDEQLDFGCGVGCGTFEALWDADGLATINTASEERALVYFLMRFLAHLQTLGTAPALDIEEYSHWAGEVDRLFER